MSENEISQIVVDTAFQIHKQLGPGLFETVYEEIMVYELLEKNMIVERQKVIPVFWKGKKLTSDAFKADLIVEKKVLVEIKSIETLGRVHYKQVLCYIKLADVKLGLLINFNEPLIKDGIHRIVNNL